MLVSEVGGHPDVLLTLSLAVPVVHTHLTPFGRDGRVVLRYGIDHALHQLTLPLAHLVVGMVRREDDLPLTGVEPEDGISVLATLVGPVGGLTPLLDGSRAV